MLVDSGRRQSIGRFPDISLKQARDIAYRKFAEKALEDHEAPKLGFAEAFDRYLAIHCHVNNKPRTAAETERLISKHFLPKWRNRQLPEISTHDVTRIIDGILATPMEANHAFAAIRGMLNWAVRRQYIEKNPCAPLSKPATASVRTRVLSDAELGKVLLQAQKFRYPFGYIVQLLAITGQRRGEIAALRWDWINFEARMITLPEALTKNRRRHSFPYGSLIAQLLENIPRHSDYLFPAARDRRKGRPATIFAGWAKAKASFDDAMEQSNIPIDPWTLHDLRRTFATNLAALGTPIHVTEKLLNHVSGTTGGIVAVYQQHAYVDKMREALDQWEARLNSIMKS